MRSAWSDRSRISWSAQVESRQGGLDSEINGWLHTRLVGFKCPHEFRFVSELPKTATGKIQRFLLRSS